MKSSQGGKRVGAGRPKGSTNISRELRQAAQEHTEGALAVLVEIMQDTDHPQRLKAVQMILDRGHGAPREDPASVGIIGRFIDGKLSAIAACLMLEAEGLKVPETMQEYFRNEVAVATHKPFDVRADVLNTPPSPTTQKLALSPLHQYCHCGML